MLLISHTSLNASRRGSSLAADMVLAPSNHSCSAVFHAQGWSIQLLLSFLPLVTSCCSTRWLAGALKYFCILKMDVDCSRIVRGKSIADGFGSLTSRDFVNFDVDCAVSCHESPWV